MKVTARLAIFLALTPAAIPVLATPHTLSSGELATGVTFEWNILANLGWEISSDPEDFPLVIEGKTTDLLLGLTHRETGAQIFMIYGISSRPVFLRSIPIEPPDDVLNYLEIGRQASSRGEYDPSFLSLGAIRWYMTAPGNGQTFLPPDGIKSVSTSSVRTILAFTLIPVSEEPRHVTVTALLRCRSSVQDRVISDYKELLQTLRPVEPNAFLVASERYRDETALIAEGGIFREMLALAQKYLPLLKDGTPLNPSAEELATIRSFLESIDPDDRLANALLASSREPRLPPLTDKAKNLYIAYLEYCHENAAPLDQRVNTARHYSERVIMIDPDHPLATFANGCQTEEQTDEEWLDPTNGHLYRCQKIASHINGSLEVLYSWVSQPLKDGEIAADDNKLFRWIQPLETWFPLQAKDGDRLHSRGDRIFHAFHTSSQNEPIWITVSNMGSVAKGLAVDPCQICPAGTTVLSGELISDLGDDFEDFALDEIKNGNKIDRIFVCSTSGSNLMTTTDFSDRLALGRRIPRDVQDSTWGRVCLVKNGVR